MTTTDKPKKQRTSFLYPEDELLQHAFLTIEEVAQLLRVCRSTIYNLIHKGVLRATRLSYHVTLITKEDFLTMIENNSFIPDGNDYAPATKSVQKVSQKQGNKNRHGSGKRTTARTPQLSVKATFIESDQCDEPCYTLSEVCRKFNMSYSRFYTIRMHYDIPTIKADGTKCFPCSVVDAAMAAEDERLGRARKEFWYSCFDIMQLYGLGKTQVRRFAQTHNVRIKKCGKNNFYLKADWEAARKQSEAISTSTKQKRE